MHMTHAHVPYKHPARAYETVQIEALPEGCTCVYLHLYICFVAPPPRIYGSIMHMYMHVYMHMHMYMCMYAYVSTCSQARAVSALPAAPCGCHTGALPLSLPLTLTGCRTLLVPSPYPLPLTAAVPVP